MIWIICKPFYSGERVHTGQIPKTDAAGKLKKTGSKKQGKL